MAEYKLSAIERETIINFNEAEPTATVYTYNRAMLKRISDLAERFPAEVELKNTDEWGGTTYTIPKRWVKVNGPRILSEAEKEQRRKARESAKLHELNSGGHK